MDQTIQLLPTKQAAASDLPALERAPYIACHGQKSRLSILLIQALM